MTDHVQVWRRDRASCLIFLIGLLLTPIAMAQQGSPGTGMEYRIPPMSLKSSNSFDDWYRYPAEEREWLRMTAATAYTRDVIAGGQTLILGADDGETWHATALRPDGTTITWGTIRFYSSYSGYEDCFVSPSWVICNATSLYVLWYTDVQCEPNGDWSMTFYNNGNPFFTGEFLLLPRIPPGKVPLYNQGAYSDAYDTICRTRTETGELLRDVFPCDGRPNEVPWTIAGKGCAMTSGAMVLGYHGVNVDPATLNTWLINHNGYDLMGNVYWDSIAAYGRAQEVEISYLGSGGTLHDNLCLYGPHVVRVPNRSHWVTATGENPELTSYLVNDPNGGVATTLGGYTQLRRYGGPEYTYTDMTGIVIRFHSPGELLVTDPEGRVTGLDPTTGQSYAEIPGSWYGMIGLEDVESGDPGPPTHDLDIRQPMAGEYLVDVVGTDSGTYALEINAYDPELNSSQAVFTDIPITPGAIHSFSFNYTKTVGDVIEPGGGFDGGGQRPSDVNKFLSYGSPGETRVQLPVGTTSYSVLVFYSDAMVPASFSATLDRVDVSSWFNPVAGGSELVNIPLQPGQNVLKLSVEGQLPTRIATDTDRLVFIVP